MEGRDLTKHGEHYSEKTLRLVDGRSILEDIIPVVRVSTHRSVCRINDIVEHHITPCASFHNPLTTSDCVPSEATSASFANAASIWYISMALTATYLPPLLL